MNVGGSILKTFTKRHIKFYLACLCCGLILSTIGSDFKDVCGLVSFTFGIIISIMSIIGILFFRKGDE